MSFLGLKLVRQQKYDHLLQSQKGLNALFAHFLHQHAEGPSRSQINQDVFVLMQTGFKRDGFFVEFGATNGKDLSNTWLLEKQFGWTGIVAEPSRMWHDDLRANRDCTIETDCVWSRTGDSLEFIAPKRGELGTLAQFKDSDFHARRRKGGDVYEVDTISLNDLLDRHNAPDFIDYLSIDTEGSELEILEAYDFSKRKIGIITVEHNYTPLRDKLHSLLTGHGYVRMLEDVSAFDDWYVLSK